MQRHHLLPWNPKADYGFQKNILLYSNISQWNPAHILYHEFP